MSSCEGVNNTSYILYFGIIGTHFLFAKLIPNRHTTHRYAKMAVLISVFIRNDYYFP